MMWTKFTKVSNYQTPSVFWLCLWDVLMCRWFQDPAEEMLVFSESLSERGRRGFTTWIAMPSLLLGRAVKQEGPGALLIGWGALPSGPFLSPETSRAKEEPFQSN